MRGGDGIPHGRRSGGGTRNDDCGSARMVMGSGAARRTCDRMGMAPRPVARPNGHGDRETGHRPAGQGHYCLDLAPVGVLAVSRAAWPHRHGLLRHPVRFGQWPPGTAHARPADPRRGEPEDQAEEQHPAQDGFPLVEDRNFFADDAKNIRPITASRAASPPPPKPPVTDDSHSLAIDCITSPIMKTSLSLVTNDGVKNEVRRAKPARGEDVERSQPGKPGKKTMETATSGEGKRTPAASLGRAGEASTSPAHCSFSVPCLA